MRDGDKIKFNGKTYVYRWRPPRGREDNCYYCTGCENCDESNPDNYELHKVRGAREQGE